VYQGGDVVTIPEKQQHFKLCLGYRPMLSPISV